MTLYGLDFDWVCIYVYNFLCYFPFHLTVITRQQTVYRLAQNTDSTTPFFTFKYHYVSRYTSNGLSFTTITKVSPPWADNHRTHKYSESITCTFLLPDHIKIWRKKNVESTDRNLFTPVSEEMFLLLRLSWNTKQSNSFSGCSPNRILYNSHKM
jgi:hypothetical protein